MDQQTSKLVPATEVIRKRIRQVRDRKELIGEQNTKCYILASVWSTAYKHHL
jgi:hypothetical protein